MTTVLDDDLLDDDTLSIGTVSISLLISESDNLIYDISARCHCCGNSSFECVELQYRNILLDAVREHVEENKYNFVSKHDLKVCYMDTYHRLRATISFINDEAAYETPLPQEPPQCMLDQSFQTAISMSDEGMVAGVPLHWL